MPDTNFCECCAVGGLERYRHLLGCFSERHYQPVFFASYTGEDGELLLRHDVDISLEHAVTVANADADMGFQSTFFLLLTTEFYNVLSAAGRTAVKRIVSLGHEIGLHFDVTSYSEAELESEVARECEILEDISGESIRVIAPHRPTATCQQFLGRPGRFAGRLQAYAPEFFIQTGYVSDSAGSWSYGSPLEHPSFKRGAALQMLTHPYLWAAPGNTQPEKIHRTLARRGIDLAEAARSNFRALEMQSGNT